MNGPDQKSRSWLQPTGEDLREIGEQEELERPLLAGRWITAAEALKFATELDDGANAAAFLLSAAAREHDRRPMLRTKAAKAEATPRAFPLPVRRDRIVHSFEWDGDVAIAQWRAGFFELRSRHFSGRVLTLTGVEFSLDDLEVLLGTKDEHTEIAGTSPLTRRRTYDQAAFIAQAVELLKDEGGFSADFTPAALHAEMEIWCRDRWPKVPGRTWIYDQFNEAERQYKNSLSDLT